MSTILSNGWKLWSLKDTSYAGEEKDSKGGEHLKNCMIRKENKKNQTTVSIYVVKEDLHT